jgi:hypothetical protein
MGPELEENLLSQASTYVRNIQKVRSKKLFAGKFPGRWRNPNRSPILI